MGKTIRLNRIEYVKEFYTVDWTEEDYKSLLKWLSEHNTPDAIATYAALKELSFDDIVSILEGYKRDIAFKIVYNTGTDAEWSYEEYIGDYIRQMIREDCWNMGCYDSECYDSDEDVEFFD